MFFGIIDLTVPFDQDPRFFESYLLETGWGLLYTFLVAAPLVALAIRPGLTMPIVQVAAAGVAVGVTAVVSGSFGQLLPAGLLLLNAAFVADLGRGHVGPRQGWRLPRVDPFMVVVVTPLAGASVAYAVDVVIGYYTRRTPTNDDAWGLDHWPMQAALALTLALGALGVASGVRNGWSGTATSAACVAVTAAWFGVVCIVYPDHAASVGETWGAAVAAWAAVFAVLTAGRLLRHRVLVKRTTGTEAAGRSISPDPPQ